ncbi:MAG: DegT/DnrJ/EryC1/StrS family aminotransferase [Staphylococcus equorum]|nr:DegT/DnrJ/EryC1/StrS family aminotransferase [Tetragenococcus koreensis]MDN6571523.1 DegT/DnrJ/EryC1/StrS family aminotransferase [Staphylococcus equorum]MDN6750842.1 DegT/DnrJ/EryC1/StrS family aminotransferase [Staphylococcus equorum]
MKDKILVTQSSLPEFDEYVEEISSIWDSYSLTNNGEKAQQLEKSLCNYLDVDETELFSSGHMALELALQALDLEGEVITTPFTFVSTTHAIVRNGLTPVFCDIKENDFTLDPSQIEDLITEKTCAILPVHVYGNICDVNEIERIAKKYDLKVIYDAAHAFGVTYKNQDIANFGDASMFSFHATKVFNTIEGGAVTTSNNQLAYKLSQLRNFGLINENTIEEPAPNAKMNEFQAAMGICNLRHIEENIDARKKVVERYRSNLKEVRGVRLSGKQEDVEPNYAYFPIVVDEVLFGCDRDELSTFLNDNNVFPRKYFYPLTSKFDCYKHEYYTDTTQIAEKVANSVLTLPLFPNLSLEKVDYICELIKSKGANK